MKKHVIFIHSAGNQGPDQGSSGLAAYLLEALGEEHHLLFPNMPVPEIPEYAIWKAKLDEVLAALKGEVILIGHSLGGSVLIKYLSEEACDLSIAGLFMIAAPFWSKDDWDWQSTEYTLQENFVSNLPDIPKMYFYHSFNDYIVPLTHLGHYMEKLPGAAIRVLKGDEHFFTNGLPELADDIRSL